jgi:RNA polymerase sigma factor (sigma-70 family)
LTDQGFVQLARLERRWMCLLAHEQDAGRLALDMAEDAIREDRLGKVLVLDGALEEAEAIAALRSARLACGRHGLGTCLQRLRPTREALATLEAAFAGHGMTKAHKATLAVLDARNGLVAGHRGLVGKVVAKKRATAGGPDIDSGDLFQEATFALMRAVDRFRPAYGNSFASYAYRGIEGAVVQASLQQRQIIAVPEEARRLRAQAAKVRDAFLAAKGRQPSEGELARTLGCAPASLREMETWGQASLSLDAWPSDGGEGGASTPHERYAGISADPGETMDRAQAKQSLAKAVAGIADPRIRKAMVARLQRLEKAETAERSVRATRVGREEARGFELLRQDPMLRKLWEAVA